MQGELGANDSFREEAEAAKNAGVLVEELRRRFLETWDLAARSTSLHTAVAAGHLYRVKALVAAGADIEEKQDVAPCGQCTPLYHAALKGNVAVARYLVDCGANKEATSTDDDTTALHVAGRSGHFVVVRMLVEQGADNGWTPLMKASFAGCVAVVEDLLKQGCATDRCCAVTEYTALHAAAIRGHIDVVRALVEYEADTEAADNNGDTPLLCAAYEGHVAVAEFLLEHGCNIDHADTYGSTALHLAAFKGRLKVVRLLLRYGAKLDMRDAEGRTPADVADARDHNRIVYAIYDHGLHKAAAAGKLKEVQALEYEGADLNATKNPSIDMSAERRWRPDPTFTSPRCTALQ